MTEKLRAIRDAYMSSFGKEKQKVTQEVTKGKLPPLEPITQREAVKLGFAQLAQSKQLDDDLEREDPLIEKQSWLDLNLICGNNDMPEKHALANIKHTTTTLGDCVMATELVTPTENVERIHEKQAIISCLLAQKNKTKKLENCLQALNKDENERLRLFKKDNLLMNSTYHKSLENFFYKGSLGSWTLFTPDSKSKGSLLGLKIFKDFVMGGFYCLPLALFFISCELYILDVNVWNIQTLSACLVMLFFSAVRAGMHFFSYRGRMCIIRFLAERMASLQPLFHEAKRISRIVASCPALEACYGKHLTATRKLLNEESKQSDLGKLIMYLRTLPLRKWSFFFSHTGKLLAAFTLFQENKHKLSGMIYELGKLDVRIAIVKLLQQSQTYSTRNAFMLSTVKPGGKNTHPSLKAVGLWHPGLDANKAVSNEVMLHQEQIRSMIVTGPNTGGKSVYILSIGINTILSQTFGIAAAKTFTHHAFSKIITYVNPTQELSKGLSLAEAGFEVLKKHKQIIEKAPGAVLAIIDEILNGIDPDVAIEISREILEARHKKYPYCLSVITTHYKPLTTLETIPGFLNRKVVVKVPGSYGSPFDPTYKIEDGISDQNIVREMLVHKGVINSLK